MSCEFSLGRAGRRCGQEVGDNLLGLCARHHARAQEILAGKNAYTTPCATCGQKRAVYRSTGICHSCYTKQWRRKKVTA